MANTAGRDGRRCGIIAEDAQDQETRVRKKGPTTTAVQQQTVSPIFSSITQSCTKCMPRALNISRVYVHAYKIAGNRAAIKSTLYRIVRYHYYGTIIMGRYIIINIIVRIGIDPPKDDPVNLRQLMRSATFNVCLNDLVAIFFSFLIIVIIIMVVKFYYYIYVYIYIYTHIFRFVFDG